MFVKETTEQPRQAVAGFGAFRNRIRAVLGCDDDSGSALMEFAIALPPLLLIVTGIMVFGVATNNYIALTNATNIGARAIAISRGQVTDPCAVGSNAVIGATPNLTASNLSFAYVFNGTSYTGTSCSSSSTNTGAAGNLVQGKPITLTVTYPCSLAVYGHNYAPTACNLQAQITEVEQ